jgi:hypothetical protein
MLSIIVCSRQANVSEQFKINIEETVHCEYELIVIDNSKNEYSIFAAYNKGFKISKFPYLCFVHEDVEFKTLKWGEKLIKHFDNQNVGLIGVAGGVAAFKIIYNCSTNPRYEAINIIHPIKVNNCIELHKSFRKINEHSQAQAVVLLDGVFLASKRELFEKCQFDESFGGFHGYDMDICLTAFDKGYVNYVIFDIDIVHYSRGKFGQQYLLALKKLHEKWSKKLPMIIENINISNKEQKNIEKKNYSRIIKLMVRMKMEISDVEDFALEITNHLDKETQKKLFAFFKIRLFLIKVTSFLRNKMQ